MNSIDSNWIGVDTDAWVNAAVAVSDVLNAEHAFLVQIVFVALHQWNVIFEPLNSQPEIESRITIPFQQEKKNKLLKKEEEGEEEEEDEV